MRIGLLGYGKMGKAIEQLAMQLGHEVVLRVHSASPLSEDMLFEAKPDVCIEFSRPEKAFDHIRICLEAGVPVVSGTTGWLERKPELEELCRNVGGAFFYAANFSIGVNVFFALNRYLAKLMKGLPQYEPSLEEIHHVHKLDAPSGTAIHLAEELIKYFPGKKRWVKGQAAGEDELAVVSHRKGEVAGTHIVRWRSEEDELVLTHWAFSRKGFALGALRAAEWLQGRKGCFGMEDMLNICCD